MAAKMKLRHCHPVYNKVVVWRNWDTSINSEQKLNKSVFSLVNSAVNMALPAYAAERCAAAPCYHSQFACDRAVS